MEDWAQTFVLTVRNLALSVSKLIPKRLILGLTGHCTLQIENEQFMNFVIEFADLICGPL